MNKYEMVLMTYPELKVLRALVEGGRDMLLINGSKATQELDSLKEKLDVAAGRIKQREYLTLKLKEGR